ncbi:MAG: EutN/CcmL family microcompartment protein [Eubacteriales bacterium]
MYTGKVVGSVVATIKDENLQNIPLLAVRLIENGKQAGLIIAADSTGQAGKGDFVNLIGSKEAARMFRKKYTPADIAIIGFIDHYNEQL